jgi:hypothetical protein
MATSPSGANEDKFGFDEERIVSSAIGETRPPRWGFFVDSDLFSRGGSRPWLYWAAALRLQK